MPQENTPETKEALDMSLYLPDDGDHDDSDLKGLDFGNDIDESASDSDNEEDLDIEVPEKTAEDEKTLEDETPADTGEGEEAEEEAEEEGEETPEETPEPAAGSPKKNPMIPKRRLDDVIAKQRRAEQEAADLRKELAEAKKTAAVKPNVDIKALSKARNEAILDGDLDKAAELDEEIYNTRSAAPEAAEAPSIEEIEERVTMKMELKNVLDTVFTDFPQLNPESDQFDEDLNTEAVMFQKTYIENGYTPGEAVKRAADAAIKLNRPELLTQANQEAPKAPAPRKTNVAKNVEASNKQPPKLNQGESGGKGSTDMVDISKLTDEEFDALPEATRARLRGDLG